jgi:hypothetical protein
MVTRHQRSKHAAPPPEGLISATVRRVTDTSDVCFLFALSTISICSPNSGRVRETVQEDRETVGFTKATSSASVSSGPSSTPSDMTYDRKRIDEAIAKIAGSA